MRKNTEEMEIAEDGGGEMLENVAKRFEAQ